MLVADHFKVQVSRCLDAAERVDFFAVPLLPDHLFRQVNGAGTDIGRCLIIGDPHGHRSCGRAHLRGVLNGQLHGRERFACRLDQVPGCAVPYRLKGGGIYILTQLQRGAGRVVYAYRSGLSGDQRHRRRAAVIDSQIASRGARHMADDVLGADLTVNLYGLQLSGIDGVGISCLFNDRFLCAAAGLCHRARRADVDRDFVVFRLIQAAALLAPPAEITLHIIVRIVSVIRDVARQVDIMIGGADDCQHARRVTRREEADSLKLQVPAGPVQDVDIGEAAREVAGIAVMNETDATPFSRKFKAERIDHHAVAHMLCNVSETVVSYGNIVLRNVDDERPAQQLFQMVESAHGIGKAVRFKPGMRKQVIPALRAERMMVADRGIDVVGRTRVIDIHFPVKDIVHAVAYDLRHIGKMHHAVADRQRLEGDKRQIDQAPVSHIEMTMVAVSYVVFAVQLLLCVGYSVMLYQPLVRIDPDFILRLRRTGEGVISQLEVVVQVGIVRVVFKMHIAPGDEDLLPFGNEQDVLFPAAFIDIMYGLKIHKSAVILCSAYVHIRVDIPGDHSFPVLDAQPGDVNIVDGLVVDIRSIQRLDEHIARRVVQDRALTDRYVLRIFDRGIRLRISARHETGRFALRNGPDEFVFLTGQRRDTQISCQVVDIRVPAQIYCQFALHAVAGLKPSAGVTEGGCPGICRGVQDCVRRSRDGKTVGRLNIRALADGGAGLADRPVLRVIFVGADRQAQVRIARRGARVRRILTGDPHRSHPTAALHSAGGQELCVIPYHNIGEQVGKGLDRAGGEPGQRCARSAVHNDFILRGPVAREYVHAAVVGFDFDVIAQRDGHAVLVSIFAFADRAGGLCGIDFDDADADARNLGYDVQRRRILRLDQDRPVLALEPVGVHGHGGISVDNARSFQTADAQQAFKAVALQRLRVRLAGCYGLDGQIAGGADGRPAGNGHRILDAAVRFGLVDCHAAKQRDLGRLVPCLARTADGSERPVSGVIAGDI